MPRTFNFGFRGGNPIVIGTAQHIDGTEGGVFEIVDPEYINRLETACDMLASGIVETQTNLNAVIVWMNNNLTQSPFHADVSGVLSDASGNLPDQL